jgi:aspartate racemase
MQHIGIVACSAEGAALCYQTICQEGSRSVGKHDHPRITLDSIPLARWMPAFERGDDDALADIVLASAQVLQAAGAELLICPDNSAHRAWRQVESRSTLPWLHIARVVRDAAERIGARRVGVLGTHYTMEGPVYRDAFAERGIDTVVPPEPDRATIHATILDELVDGVFTDASRAVFHAIIERLRDDGCDAVALACTEIPLLMGSSIGALPTLDSTRLLARAALEVAALNGAAPVPRPSDD